MLAAALQDALIHVSLEKDNYQPHRIDPTGDGVRLTLTVRDDPSVYALEWSPRPPYVGVSTGEPCATPQEWAQEVWLLLMEAVDTRSIDGAPRTRLPDGVVLIGLRTG